MTLPWGLRPRTSIPVTLFLLVLRPAPPVPLKSPLNPLSGRLHVSLMATINPFFFSFFLGADENYRTKFPLAATPSSNSAAMESRGRCGGAEPSSLSEITSASSTRGYRPSVCCRSTRLSATRNISSPRSPRLMVLGAKVRGWGGSEVDKLSSSVPTKFSFLDIEVVLTRKGQKCRSKTRMSGCNPGMG